VGLGVLRDTINPDPSVEVETEALAAYLRESNADDDWLDRT
jgi:hypothetical protein